jgi:metallophosphoesterase superfamily enzyme
VRILDDWLLTPQRIAVHLPTATAVVADLHLGYDEARRRAGEAVPRVSVASQLTELGEALERHQLRRLIIAGDLLEDGQCVEALAAFRKWLGEANIELVGLAPGNHDGCCTNAKGSMGGILAEKDWPVFEAGVPLGSWRVVHGDGPLPPGLVVHGHEHPWVRWRNGPEAACYLVGSGRLVLPAYSADAAGVNVVGAARWRPFRCLVVVGREVLDFGPVGGLRRRR